MYEDQYCSRCVHHDGADGKSGCHVWLAHLLFNYKECGTGSAGEQILDLLIPQNEHDTFNAQCSMFHAARPEDKPQRIEPMPAMREWAKERGLI